MSTPDTQRDWTAPLRLTGYEPTQLHVHALQAAAAEPALPAPACPPCRRDHTCHQGRCAIAAGYLQRAQYASAAHRLVARKLAERRHRRADRALAAATACALALIAMGAI